MGTAAQSGSQLAAGVVVTPAAPACLHAVRAAGTGAAQPGRLGRGPRTRGWGDPAGLARSGDCGGARPAAPGYAGAVAESAEHSDQRGRASVAAAGTCRAVAGCATSAAARRGDPAGAGVARRAAGGWPRRSVRPGGPGLLVDLWPMAGNRVPGRRLAEPLCATGQLHRAPADRALRGLVGVSPGVTGAAGASAGAGSGQPARTALAAGIARRPGDSAGVRLMAEPAGVGERMPRQGPTRLPMWQPDWAGAAPVNRC